MSEPIVVGIDPGRKGAAVAVRGGVPCASTLLVFNGTEFDVGHLAGWLKDIDLKDKMTSGSGIRLVVVERQSTRPAQGVVSSFKIGQNYGELRGLVSTLGFSLLTPTPAKWIKRMVSGSKRDKKANIAACRRLMPTLQLTPHPKRTPQDGLADAGLIALYGEQWLKANDSI
tara:strand:- start:1113 stop:1625 length:513 start_codon:yes stop_codon:yes gene_type:complete